VQLPVYDPGGNVVESIEVSDDLFGVPFHEPVVHQALVRQLANRRQGTVETRTRAEVAGSGRKLFSQKHTGRARRGSITSPLLRGGGITFGPHQRDYRQDMPKRMRRLALKSVISARCADGGLKVLRDIRMEQPRTKVLAEVLRALNVKGSVLLATGEVEANVVKAAHNLPGASVTPVAQLNVADIISHKNLVMTVEAVRKAESLWASEEKARKGSSRATGKGGGEES
jgi:large subunit ribosomal protein L4